MRIKSILKLSFLFIGIMGSFNAFAKKNLADDFYDQDPDILHKAPTLGWYYDDYQDKYYPFPKQLRDYRWIMGRNGWMPNDAFVGGFEPNRQLYICQAYYMDGVHPGKFIDGLTGGTCHIGYGGQEIVIHDRYRILVGRGLGWMYAANGYVPRNAVVGGSEDGHPLYVCRANYSGGKHPGKIIGKHCMFGYAGVEIMQSYYEVLINLQQ